jgi:glycerol uptake facilitator protein
VITVVGPVTGAALNPARYIGPMIAAASLGGSSPLWGQVPTYFVATFVAGLLAAGAYRFLGGVKSAPAVQPTAEERVRVSS